MNAEQWERIERAGHLDAVERYAAQFMAAKLTGYAMDSVTADPHIVAQKSIDAAVAFVDCIEEWKTEQSGTGK